MRYWLIGTFCLLLSACATQTTVSNSPRNFDTVEAAKTRISLGLTYLENGNYNQAKANLDKAMEYAPRLGDSHFALAHYYQTVSDFGLAEKYYQQAFDLDPNNPNLQNSYGAFLCQKGDYNQAEKYLLKAANSERYSSTAETYENLAICSHSQARINQAIEYLETALQHQPGRGKSWYMLIELFLSKGMYGDAKDAFRQYEKLVPVTADTLSMAIEIEEGLGNDKVAKGYQAMLEQLYPDRVNLPRRKLLAPVSRENSQPESPVELVNSNVQTHILQKGENLYRLAIKYGVRIQWLIDWNNIDDVSNLSVGQELIVSDPNL